MNSTTQSEAVVTLVSQTVRGRHVRFVSRVTFADGRSITFMDRMSKRAALAQARTAHAWAFEVQS